MDRAFDEREKSFEAKYKLDQELEFKAQARRDKLVGLWAAELMGKTGATAEAYAKEVVVADLDAPGDDDVIAKLVKDFAAAEVAIAVDDIRAQMERMYAVAIEQLRKEFPEPLGPDHAPVGG